MYQTEVKIKVDGQHHLIPLFTSTHTIPERVYEYNPRLFIVYNSKSERFEVHSLDQEFSHCAELPYKSLDARTVRWIQQNDVRVHGKEIMRRLEESEERLIKSKERERKNWIESVGKETKSMFAKDAWTEL